jgi:hypothetical protein
MELLEGQDIEVDTRKYQLEVIRSVIEMIDEEGYLMQITDLPFEVGSDTHHVEPLTEEEKDTLAETVLVQLEEMATEASEFYRQANKRRS